MAKEVEPARTEFKADLKAELRTVTLLCVAGVLTICSVGITVVAAVFAIATSVAGLLLAIDAVLALMGNKRHVSAHRP